MFWPTVLDTYGEDLDAHIAPQDTALLTCVTGINVVRTDPETEPRNFSIEFSFDKNASKFFTQTSLAKKFWWRVVEGQWSGIVSEPVEIHWVKGKDITNGETDRAWKRHVAKKQQQSAENANGKGKEKQKKKGEKSNNGSGKEEKSMTIEERMGGGQPSFFTWFAWKGHGRDDPFVDDLNDEDDEEDENDENVDLFSHGDELALLICNDLYPEATKYFSMSSLHVSPHVSYQPTLLHLCIYPSTPSFMPFPPLYQLYFTTSKEKTTLQFQITNHSPFTTNSRSTQRRK